jgi:penicillin-binding protein-related factor A (putative recombinase)
MIKLDKGKWAEKEAQKCLEKLSQASCSLSYHRLPDSHSARNFLQAQPADYLVVSGGNTTFLEVKESANPSRIPKAKISQWGALYRFHLAGASVLVLIYQSTHKHWVFLTNSALFEGFEDCPASFPLTNLPTFASAGEALEEYFK